MKKSIKVAGLGVAAFGFATLPVAGAFAANDPITDQVQVSIDSTCTFSGTVSNPRTATVALGSSGTVTGTAMTVKCNTSGGWSISAQGMNGTGTDATASTVMTNGTSAEDIATGTSGTDSYWGFQIAKTDASSYATIADGYNSLSEIPSTATSIVTGNATDLTTGVVVTPTYTVSLSNDQASGTYNGYVKYSFTAGA